MARGNGSIFQPTYTRRAADGTHTRHKSRSWWIRWTDSAGTRRQLRIGADHNRAREVLRKKLGESIDELNGIKRCDLARLRLSDLAARFLESRRPHVTAQQLGELRSQLFRAFADTKAVMAAALTREAVERYLERLARGEVAGQESPAAPRTVNKNLGTLKSLFNWALAVGEIAHNPLASIRPRPCSYTH